VQRAASGVPERLNEWGGDAQVSAGTLPVEGVRTR
jgi:hypothetical protein